MCSTYLPKYFYGLIRIINVVNTMPELFQKGICRIIYKSKNFVTGKTVTAHIWSPNFVKSPLLTLTEIGEGLYYLDYDFTLTGTFIGLFYEDGQKSTIGIFRVDSTFKPEICPICGSPKYLGRCVRFTQHPPF